MANVPASPPNADSGSSDSGTDRIRNAICRSVMTTLGQPKDFLKITLRAVSGNSYRVNVVTGEHLASARIAHSFFVTVDEKGNLTSSQPTISKAY